MSKADELIDRAADKLQALADESAGQDGLKAKLAEELAEDAAFLRKLKPSLVAARVRGDAPTDEAPGAERRAPSGPQLGSYPGPSPKRSASSSGGGAPGGGPNPFVVVVAALAVGIFLAKWIDWRGHAHPRD